ncbi:MULTISPECIES: Lcl C-terminal domain-containing protein [unclassified Pseudoalteromonas]|uniref:Lcl C-terminal domain-containing protein n=1 Tax=unclassified Pseudoalteromonas TaxID=194690 RepID=UPI003014F03E
MKISTILLFTLLVFGGAFNEAYGECQDNIPPSTPTSRFTLNDNGTVTDNQTGLMWMRCSLGQAWDGTTCTESVSTYTWAEALASADESNYAGFSDWYLPNIKELASIVEAACYNPAINQTVFPNTASSSYWSSSPHAYYGNYAWSVYFNRGYDYNLHKDNGTHVRLVRAGADQ